jgi:hypothetical protein
MSRSKVLIPSVLLVAAVLAGLAVLSFNMGQSSNMPAQKTIQTASPADSASDYFVLQSQQEFFDAIKAGQAREIFAKIG